MAAPWVNAFTGENERDWQIEDLTRRWRLTDPDACRAWLEAIQLPEERRRQFVVE